MLDINNKAMPEPKIAYLTFCRGIDSDLVNIADRVLYDRIDSPLRFIVDEPDSSVSINNTNTNIITEEFDRGETLNGLECCVGIIQVMQSVARECECDYIFKIDADVIMMGTSFKHALRHGGYVSYGKGINQQVQHTDGKSSIVPYCQGAAYAISSKALSFLPEDRDGIESLFIDADYDCDRTLSTPRKQGYQWPEDESISRLMRNQFRNLRQFGWKESGHLGSWEYDRMGTTFNRAYASRLRVYDFVEMGQTAPLFDSGLSSFEERRSITESNMSKTASMILENR
tara:strand:+ start:675 stop:1532 length:858 start_codon:yes stop_codon:yes gene_type:complete